MAKHIGYFGDGDDVDEAFMTKIAEQIVTFDPDGKIVRASPPREEDFDDEDAYEEALDESEITFTGFHDTETDWYAPVYLDDEVHASFVPDSAFERAVAIVTYEMEQVSQAKGYSIFIPGYEEDTALTKTLWVKHGLTQG